MQGNTACRCTISDPGIPAADKSIEWITESSDQHLFLKLLRWLNVAQTTTKTSLDMTSSPVCGQKRNPNISVTNDHQSSKPKNVTQTIEDEAHPRNRRLRQLRRGVSESAQTRESPLTGAIKTLTMSRQGSRSRPEGDRCSWLLCHDCDDGFDCPEYARCIWYS